VNLRQQNLGCKPLFKTNAMIEPAIASSISAPENLPLATKAHQTTLHPARACRDGATCV